jgi:hypothetical protein
MTLDASAANVSTDQGVFVEIEDAEKPARLHVESAALFGTVARRTTTLAVIVPAETHVLRVRLARKASLKFDNALAGTLYIHRLALERSAKTGTSS